MARGTLLEEHRGELESIATDQAAILADFRGSTAADRAAIIADAQLQLTDQQSLQIAVIQSQPSLRE